MTRWRIRGSIPKRCWPISATARSSRPRVMRRWVVERFFHRPAFAPRHQEPASTIEYRLCLLSTISSRGLNGTAGVELLRSAPEDTYPDLNLASSSVLV